MPVDVRLQHDVWKHEWCVTACPQAEEVVVVAKVAVAGVVMATASGGGGDGGSTACGSSGIGIADETR